MQRGDKHAREGTNKHKVSAGGPNKRRGMNAAMMAAEMAAVGILCGPPLLLFIYLAIFTYKYVHNIF